jgi:fucose 4-O-acetylase-like acetyltransferase
MKRLNYIDRVKGLLIISVVLGHAAWSIGLMDYNYPYVCYPFNETAFLYVGIFMQAFFLVSGYVSNFHKDFKTFIIKNIQTIIVPLLTLGFAKQIFEGLLTADNSLFSMGGGMRVCP